MMQRKTACSQRGELKGFTLIELLVVVAIIALLVSILLPSLQNARKQAQAVACMSNLNQIVLALRMYQDEHAGWLPLSDCSESVYGDGVGSSWSEAAWFVPKRKLWFYQLTYTYMGNPDAYICPADPFAGEFEFEARDDITKPACGYGLTYIIRHWGTDLFNLDRYQPSMPSGTILLAEVGPDSGPEYAPLHGSADDGSVAWPWRDGGRLLWDDGVRAWYPGVTWLTARHLGAINMVSMDGAIRRVPTVEQLTSEIEDRYDDCYGFIWQPGDSVYLCPLCFGQPGYGPTRHYNFAPSNLRWWTGAFPE